MRPGYLSIESHEDHRGLTRLILSDHQPDPEPTRHAARRIRYIARFNDSAAALMHTHEILKRRLIDPDSHLYRVPPARAIAAVESLDIRHRRVYLDADLSVEEQAKIAEQVEQLRRQRRSRDAFFQALGYIGLGILLFNLFVLSFP